MREKGEPEFMEDAVCRCESLLTSRDLVNGRCPSCLTRLAPEDFTVQRFKCAGCKREMVCMSAVEEPTDYFDVVRCARCTADALGFSAVDRVCGDCGLTQTDYVDTDLSEADFWECPNCGWS